MPNRTKQPRKAPSARVESFSRAPGPAQASGPSRSRAATFETNRKSTRKAKAK